MQVESATTPFGRRSMSIAMLLSQSRVKDIASDHSVDKWKIFRALCEAKPLLGISDRALAVLNALLSFYPGNLLSKETGLVIFPSNAQLSLRAHGIAPATLRRHLAALVDADLLIRKDSPNGKRYARRDAEGEIGQAYGFSIAPLIIREKEISLMAAQVWAAREQYRITKEQLSLCRRDLTKLIETAQREGLTEDFSTLQEAYQAQISQIPRAPTIHHFLPILERLEALRANLLNSLESHANSKIAGANESHSERHIEESHPESISESQAIARKVEPDDVDLVDRRGFRFSQSENVVSNRPVPEQATAPCRNSVCGTKPVRRKASDTPGPTLSIGMVVRACPEIAGYAPGGSVRSWRDLSNAALVVHRMLCVSADAFDRACRAMGREVAAVVMACILQKTDQIASAGGYLRDLTRRAEQGSFSVAPMLSALLKMNAASRSAIALQSELRIENSVKDEIQLEPSVLR